MKKYLGELGLIIVAIIWGSGFVASDLALNNMTPIQVMTFRFSIAAIIMGIIFMKKFKKIKRKTFNRGLLLGVLLFFAFTLQTVALQYTTASKNAFLTATNVVIVPFIGLLFKKAVDKYGVCGAIIALTGAAFLTLDSEFNINKGDVLTLSCSICFAFHIFFTGEFVKKEDPSLITSIEMITAGILSIIFLIFRREYTFTFTINAIMPAIYLGIFSTTIAFFIQTLAQKYTTETKAAIILSTEAVFGSIFSIIILNEQLTFKLIIGCLLIFLAILISETKLSFLKKKSKELIIEE
ncbi:DMT family transporter [Clostridium fallax]|uniref:Permease of the drug/metabolite transporter (DMT) superfamily n=1 Tax=Clostridium fallax TaxID=1533 RepID=A0A1M4SV55_9CLOT|nr:DMT family transporter [Clostridium fallax]SHE35857.1 Permease of the drug/metabolite transporter (DMT) superfamily [Clostridium fallax]SQB07979.1 transporter [Clostridium fallax]